MKPDQRLGLSDPITLKRHHEGRMGFFFFQSITEDCLNVLEDNLLTHQIVQA